MGLHIVSRLHGVILSFRINFWMTPIAPKIMRDVSWDSNPSSRISTFSPQSQCAHKTELCVCVCWFDVPHSSKFLSPFYYRGELFHRLQRATWMFRSYLANTIKCFVYDRKAYFMNTVLFDNEKKMCLWCGHMLSFRSLIPFYVLTLRNVADARAFCP